MQPSDKKKVFSLDDKQLGRNGDKQGVSSGLMTATPLGSNPLHRSTQATDAPHSQKCVASKVTGAEGEMSPTLPWPKHDLQSLQVDKFAEWSPWR